MSKFVREAQPKVTKHRHCIVCQSPIVEMDREFCSQKCQDEHAKTERTRKYTMLLMIFLLPVILLIMMLLRPG